MNDQNVIAQDLQAQLKNNLNIDADIEVQESGTFIDNSSVGKLDGIHILGWGADYPDITNFLDYHFGSGASPQFGDKFDDITSALAEGAVGLDDASRKPAYEKANNAIKAHVPMVPIWHQASAVAYRADVKDAHSSPLGNENFASMTPGDRPQFVWMQDGEPAGLYCADESDGEALRVCQQMSEAALQLRDRRHGCRPGPGHGVRPEPGAHDLDLQAARRCDVPRWRDARCQRRRPLVCQSSGMPSTRCTRAVTTRSRTSRACSVGS